MNKDEPASKELTTAAAPPIPRWRSFRAVALAALVLLVVAVAGWAMVQLVRSEDTAGAFDRAYSFPADELSAPGAVIVQNPSAHFRQPASSASIDADSPREPIEPNPPVQVIVRAHDGTPLGGARLETYIYHVTPGGRWHYRRLHVEYTASNGRAELLPADFWDAVRVEKNGFGSASNRVYRLAPVNRVDLEFRLAPPFRTSGRVVDRRGMPIAGAEVTTEPQWVAEDIEWVTTDQAGRFEIEGGPGDPIYVRHPGYAFLASEIGYDGIAGDLIMKPGGNLRIAVTRGGAPIPGAEIFLDDPPITMEDLWKTETGELGQAEFLGLPEESGYTVVAAAGGAAARIDTFVLEGQTQELRIELPASYPARVYGVVSADGSPLEGVPVYVAPAEDSDDARFAITDSAGRYEAGVDHGEYTIAPVLTRWGGRFDNPTSGQRVHMPHGDTAQEVSFALSENPLHHTALSVAGDRPPSDYMLLSRFLSGAGVWLLGAEGGYLSYSTVREFGVYDPETRLHAFIKLPGIESETLHIAKIEAHEPTRPIEGIVRDTEGRAIEGVSVTVREFMNWDDRLAAAWERTDAEGRFAIDAIADADAYFISLIKPGYLPRRGETYWDIEAPAGNAPIELVMAPLDRTITGSVVSRDGAPIPDATVIVSAGSRSRHRKRTDAEGRFTLSLPEGEFMLEARAFGVQSRAAGPFAPPASGVELMVDVQLDEDSAHTANQSPNHGRFSR